YISPMAWVNWSFAVAEVSPGASGLSFDRTFIVNISNELLIEALRSGTEALSNALSVARAIGWIQGDRDLPNALLHRVFIPDNEDVDNALDEDERDPDRYNRDFAPLVRFCSTALHVLAEREPEAARRIASQWREEHGGLFSRLYAAAGWNSL